jgi:hypothetical protein
MWMNAATIELLSPLHTFQFLSSDLITFTINNFPYRPLSLFSFGAYIIIGVFLSITPQLLTGPTFCYYKFPLIVLRSCHFFCKITADLLKQHFSVDGMQRVAW